MLIKPNSLRAVLAAGVCALALLFGAAPQALAYQEVIAEIPIDCDRFEGDRRHDYSIEILGGEADVPMPEVDRITVADGESGAFLIPIAEPGTYKYTVKEVIGLEDNVEYDTRVYDVTVFAANTENDELTYVVSATAAGTDEKPDRILFANGDGDDRSRATGDDNSDPNSRDGTGDNKGGGNGAFTGSGGITISALFLTVILLFVFKKRDDRDKNEQ